MCLVPFKGIKDEELSVGTNSTNKTKLGNWALEMKKGHILPSNQRDFENYLELNSILVVEFQDEEDASLFYGSTVKTIWLDFDSINFEWGP